VTVRFLWLLLWLSSCPRPAQDAVANHVVRPREDPVIELDRARPRRDCPREVASQIFGERAAGSALIVDACLRGRLVGDSIAVNASMRSADGRIASRRAIVSLDGHVLLHGTETVTQAGNSPPTVVALVDLDGDGKQEIIEEDETVAHQHVTRIYKVYEDTIVQLGSFPHALEDARQTCVASWKIEELARSRRALVVSARIEPPKRPGGTDDGLFECLPAGRHSFTVEDDRLVDGFVTRR
jgi:hypothetical protein